MDIWKNLEIIGEKHVDIGAPNSAYKSSSLLIKDIHIEIFSKYVHSTLDFMKLMINCIQKN